MIAIHILPNAPRNKDNQTMKFDQLIDYIMRNIFLEKLYTKCHRENIPRPFVKKSKLSTSQDQQSKILCSLLLFYANVRAIKIYWNSATDHLLLPHVKLFWKTKNSPCLIFYMIIQEKYFTYIPLTDHWQSMHPAFHFLLSFWWWANNYKWLNRFEINLIFLIKPFFLHVQKFETKI